MGKNITKNTEIVSAEKVNDITEKKTNFDFIARAMDVIKADSRTVAGKEENFITISYEKKKDGKELTVNRTVTDVATIDLVNDITKLTIMRELSDSAIVVAMGRITKKMAEAIGLNRPTDLLKAKFKSRFSENTIVKYYNIGRIFGKPSGEYIWRDGIDADVSYSNLDVVLTLINYKDLYKMSDNDVESLYNTFYNTYVRTGLVNLSATQTILKKQVQEIKNPPIDGKSKDVTDNSDNSNDNQNNSDNSNDNQNISENSETKLETAMNCLKILANVFKGSEDSEITQALSVLTDKISKMME